MPSPKPDTGREHPVALFKQHVVTVLQWQSLRGSRAIWDLIVADISKLDGTVLVGCASHWNAILQDEGGRPNIAAQVPIVNSLGSADQLAELESAMIKKHQKEGLPSDFVSPVFGRQTLLILMRLAFEYARWDGSGATPRGSVVLELLLRINDHLEGMPDLPPRARRRKGARSLADRYRAFPLTFSLQHISHRLNLEAGVARTLLMMRGIHADLTASRAKGASVDVLKLFREGSGLELELYLSLLFAALAMPTPPGRPGSPHPGSTTPIDNGVLNINPGLLRGDSAVRDDEVKRFLDEIALTPDQFKAAFAGSYQQPKQTNFTVFRSYPMVHFPGGAYRVLDKSLLLDKLASGTYWVLRRAVEQGSVEGEDRRKAVKRLNGWWGQLFEEYISRLVRNSPLAERYTSEPKLEGSKREKGDCDGLLDYGEDVVLIECKMSPLAAKPRHSISPRALAGEILAKFGGKKGTGQLV